MSDALELDATGQAELVQRGDVSPVELVDLAIAAIESLDGPLNAVIHRRFERAREEAASPELADGPFRGVPVVVKDLGAGRIAGEPMHLGNAALKAAGWTEPADSYLVEALRGGGFVLLGKTNVPELGLHATTQPRAYGPTRNPWDVERTAGGSSGGSAAAVAAGMVAAAHGSDGGGSIRIPASACGLVGLKPSRGRVSAGPMVGESSGGRSVDGCLTRTVRDTAAILDCISRPMPGDPVRALGPAGSFLDAVGAEPGPLRIGLLATRPADGVAVHPDCVAAVEATGRALEELGHRVEIDHPPALAEPAIIFAILATHNSQVAAAAAAVGRQLGREVTAEDFEPATWSLIELGRLQTGVAFVEGRAELERYGRRLASWWAGGFDLLVTPTLAEPPLPLAAFDDVEGDALASLLVAARVAPFTSTWNNVGQPAISLPQATSADGLPVGVQLVADHFREDLLLMVAAQLEAAVPWADRRPGPGR